MTVVLDSRRDIDLTAVERVAWAGEDVRISDESLERMRASRESFLRLLDDPDVVIYGVTSGYGQMARFQLDAEARRRHAAHPPYAHIVTFGDPLPERVSRTIVLARLANYLDGHAAISPDLANAVAGLLGTDKLPAVSAEGHGGAGEILALGQLLGPLAERSELREKDVLALINGSPCAAALVADAAVVARRRLPVIEEVFALSFEALQAPLEHLDPALDDLWNDPDDAAALRSLRELVTGAPGRRRAYQAPVSFRILPRMLGRLRRAIGQAEAAATRSLQAVTDNPMYVPPSDDHPNGRALSNGGFHNTLAWPAMDELAAAYADLCTLAERHTSKMLYGPVSQLPDQLRTSPTDAHYMGCMPMMQVGFAEAARRAAQRTFIPGSESGGFGQNDVATAHFFAWSGQVEAGRLLESTLAPLAMIASQAFHVTERQAPPGLKQALEQTRACAPVLEAGRMRALDVDGARLAASFRERTFGRAA